MQSTDADTQTQKKNRKTHASNKETKDVNKYKTIKIRMYN